MRSGLALIALAGAVAVAAPAQAPPRCFGAAARDPQRVCSDLGTAVRPGTARALLTPNEPCTTTGRYGNPHRTTSGVMYTCEFGVDRRRARRTVALIGDSHSMSWRAPVAGALTRLRWHGVAMSRDGCAFTTARRAFSRSEQVGCARFNRRVLGYLRSHRDVTAVFTTHQTGGTPYLAAGGRSAWDTEVHGFARAWRELPSSVTQVFAIRDNPRHAGSLRVGRCLRRARRAGSSPGPYCAPDRDVALLPDASADAVARLRSSRYALIDLTSFMCDSRCYPVVGGALVNKDGDHLTRTFARTLAPYLLRGVRRVLRR